MFKSCPLHIFKEKYKFTQGILFCCGGMKINKKKMKILLIGVVPLFLTILLVGIIYLSLPVFEYLKIPEQIGLWAGFYIFSFGICGFIYLWLYGQKLKDVLTDKDHKKNSLIAFIISLILIGIFVIGLILSDVDISKDTLGLFQIWIFFYLIPFVVIESWTGSRKRKKMKSK
jgi:MFS family permease